ncbi:MAG TPA: 2,3-bisphosphoglycerate-independent phosphoglycerate mutase [Gemmatimonadota bacterium]|nr:2,3-bisphosphoglycerate-independent phosphoglycerate mutase [Gemmatimonadota bacterium]
MRRVGLIVLDGWGLRDSREGNAVALARTPVFDALWEKYPSTRLDASGRAVGLADGQMGNSEVGHLTLGAGRIIRQDILRIDEAIEAGEFFDGGCFAAAAEHSARTGGTLHAMGLVSDGGVHSHIRHLIALLELARRRGVERVAVHAFTDGRDTSPTSGVGFLEDLQEAIDERGVGALATIVGRYYAMDRDRRWDRTRVAYEALTEGRACTITRKPIEALRKSYANDVTDEFVKPIVVEGTPRVKSGDAIVFFNFRADRARQLTRAFTDPGFDGFARDPFEDLYFATMTEFDPTFDLPMAFPPRALEDVAGDIWERAGCTNLRIAETEKYAHVTYFFNGGREEPYAGEERILVPSPKVATYDLQPEMSAPSVSDRLVEAIQSRAFDVFVCNFANPDMVGHTGDLEAAILAVEAVDGCLGRVVEAFRQAEPEGALLILADHGNAETMKHEDGSPHTAHTTNPVPCLLVSQTFRGALREGGALCDAVPTLLALQEIEQPVAMNGRDLREVG